MHLPQNGSGKDSRDFWGALALSVGHTFHVPGVPSCSAELALALWGSAPICLQDESLSNGSPFLRVNFHLYSHSNHKEQS